MHMALTTDEWLMLNTGYCNRLSASVTVAVCEGNQKIGREKFGDLRCAGCGGLDDQRLISPLKNGRSVLELVCAERSDSHGAITDTHQPADAHEVEQPATTLDDNTITDLLADLFPEDDEEAATDQKFVELIDPPETRRRRVAVYTGRCCRCGGYMTNDLERHDGIKDHDVYRCFMCGWRTSPEYANNRVLFARELEV